jgi:hypothetical protein
VTAYLARAGTAVALAADRVVITTGDAAVEVDGHLAQLWESFDRFRTLEEQSRTLRARHWEGDAATLPGDIRDLESVGLLVRREALEARLRSVQRASVLPMAAAWLSRGRPALAARSVASFAKACGPSCPELLVLDDTPDGSDTPKIAADLRSAGLAEKACIADRAGACRFRDALTARSSVPRELVAFAVEGFGGDLWRCGAARNLLQLSCLPGPLLISDDDVLFGLRLPASFEPGGWRLTARFDPLDLRYPRDGQAVGELTPAPLDPARAHGRLLGCTPADCADLGRPDLAEVTPDLADILMTGQARVAVTMAGIAGHTGSESGRMVLGLRGAARDDVMAAPGWYRPALASRTAIRAAPCWTLSAGGLLMAPSMGLDNRLCLPPFAPVGRNSEGIFAAVLRHVTPWALIGHLPYVVLHAPGPLPPFDCASLHDLRPRLAELLTLLIDAVPRALATETAARLKSLGAHLVDAASQAPAAFEHYLFELWLKHMSRYAGYLENLLSIYGGEPPEWAADVAAHLEAVAAQAAESAPVSPRDLPGDSGAALVTAQRAIRSYGELLIAWPALREAAAALDEPLFPRRSR